MTVIVTDHSVIRSWERMGLNRKALQRTAQKALDHGLTIADATGPLKSFLIGRKKSVNENQFDPYVYGQHVFILSKAAILVTVLCVPHEFQSIVNKLAKRKKTACQDNVNAV